MRPISSALTSGGVALATLVASGRGTRSRGSGSVEGVEHLWASWRPLVETPSCSHSTCILMIVFLLVLPRYESHRPPTLLPRWSLMRRWPNRDRSLMCVRRSWIDTRNGIRDLRTCRYRKFCGVVGARGVGTATIDGGVGGGGRSTGRSCRN